jgi:hypothetical protein
LETQHPSGRGKRYKTLPLTVDLPTQKLLVRCGAFGVAIFGRDQNETCKFEDLAMERLI